MLFKEAQEEEQTMNIKEFYEAIKEILNSFKISTLRLHELCAITFKLSHLMTYIIVCFYIIASEMKLWPETTSYKWALFT